MLSLLKHLRQRKSEVKKDTRISSDGSLKHVPSKSHPAKRRSKCEYCMMTTRLTLEEKGQVLSILLSIAGTVLGI